jgi:hypothetical protein
LGKHINYNLPIAANKLSTFCADLALVSKNKRPASSAYACASSLGTCLSFSSFVSAPSSISSLAKSSLLPTKAITISVFACLCNSLTHDFALSRVD